MRRRSLQQVLAAAKLVDGNCRVVRLGDSSNDVLRPQRRVTAKEDPRQRRLQGGFVEHRHARVVELQAKITLNPGKCILLADRHQHFITFHVHIRLAGRNQVAATLGINFRAHFFEKNAGQMSLVVRKLLRHKKIMDRNAFVHRIFFLPRRSLHFIEATAHHHTHVFATESFGRSAAVHRGVATAKNDDTLRNFGDVPEGHAGEPIDTNMDVGSGFLATGKMRFAAARRTSADEHRVIALGKSFLEAVYPDTEAGFHTHAQNVANLLVDHRLGQAEFRNLAADHAATLARPVKHGNAISKRQQIACDSQRRRAATDAGDTLAILFSRDLG